MEKPIKPLLFAVIVIAATASIAYVLSMLDQIVHGQLYYYGLQFSLDWANPYWSLLRIIQILLGVIAASTAINAILTVRKYFSARKPSVRVMTRQKPSATFPPPTRPASSPVRTLPQNVHPVERSFNKPVAPQQTTAPSPSPTPLSTPMPPVTLAPSPTARPASPSYSSELPGLIRCSHCGKAFTQPLRMLDFQGDRPRIVNICPFCNEIITSAPRQTEDEQDKRFQLRKKDNNHASKTLATESTS